MAVRRRGGWGSRWVEVDEHGIEFVVPLWPPMIWSSIEADLTLRYVAFDDAQNAAKELDDLLTAWEKKWAGERAPVIHSVRVKRDTSP